MSPIKWQLLNNLLKLIILDLLQGIVNRINLTLRIFNFKIYIFNSKLEVEPLGKFIVLDLNRMESKLQLKECNRTRSIKQGSFK